MKHTAWWWLSAAVSALLIAVLVNLWVQMNQYEPDECQDPDACQDPGKYRDIDASPQLINQQVVNEFLLEKWENQTDIVAGKTEPTMKVKTGIFIQSLNFFNSTEVNISGYIWQRYRNGLQDHIKPGADEIGFILPEQVNSGSDIEPREVYRVRSADEEIIGWYFEATLRQPFDYSHYPFDHKTAWVRMWHKQFSRNIVLIPDLEAYESTGLKDIYGIEKTIVLGTWERADTYYDYDLSSYDTDFGIPDYVGQQGFPELRYNFVVKRRFENAFIVYLLPLFLVATLLFAALLTVSESEELSSRLGFNTSGFIGGCSALFFVVMLAHIQLREQFAGSNIVYIEYFYILMYALLVVSTANTYLFSIRPKRWCGLILYEDNIIVKVAYWPIVLGSLILITLGVM